MATQGTSRKAATPQEQPAQQAASNDTAVEAVVQTEEGKTEEVTEYSFGALTSENIPELAAAIWERITGKTLGDREELLQEVFTAMRKARDDNRNSRRTRTVEEILAEAHGKPFGDLQAVKIPLVAGVPTSLPAIFSIAAADEHPLKDTAKALVRKHKLSTQEHKLRSKGKATRFLIVGNKPFEVPKGAAPTAQAA